MDYKPNSRWLGHRLIGLCLALACGPYDVSIGQQGEGQWKKAVRSKNVGRLLLTTCQFPVSADVTSNAKWIQTQLRQAHALHADIVHFSECALSGYAGIDHKTLDDFDWAKQRKQLESILSLADELDLWVVLGCAHRLSEGMKPHNSLYVINPVDKGYLRLTRALVHESNILCNALPDD